MECFAFGGATVRFASLETSSHATHHTVPPPPSYEGSPHCPKDKNRSPFHGEKPLVIKRILGRRSYQIFQTILHGRDAILRVRDKLLISNMILQLWADVKYHVPTGFGFSPKASGFYPWCNVVSPRKRAAEGLCGWRHGNSFPMTQSAQSHSQMRSIPHCSKAVFYVFVFDSIHDSATMHNLSPGIFH